MCARPIFFFWDWDRDFWLMVSKFEFEMRSRAVWKMKIWEIVLSSNEIRCLSQKKDSFKKRKNFKNAPIFAIMHLKKSTAPLKVEKLFWKKSWFMIVIRSVLIPRNQRKKTELNPSHGYRVFSKNAPKCTNHAHLVHLRTLSLIAP